jgi:hypothetical protein
MRVQCTLALCVSSASADPAPPYMSLFLDHGEWTLPCDRVRIGPEVAGRIIKPEPDGELRCKTSELKRIGTATLVRPDCTGSEANPSGWYAMIDRGLYRLWEGPRRPTSPQSTLDRPRSARWNISRERCASARF